MDTTVSDATLFRERGFGINIGFGNAPAVLVVDIMTAFTDPTLPLGAKMDDEIAAINEVIDAARQVQAPIFYSVVSYDEQDARDAGIWRLKMKGLASLQTGSDVVKLDPRLHWHESDSVFVKKYASCFFGTTLSSQLQAMRRDTLIIVGCTTSGCVRASVVDAVQYGFRPVLVREAVGDRSRAAHEQSLFDIQAKYGDVVNLNDALAYLHGSASEQAHS